MAVKAVLVDDSGTHHLVIALNRENFNTILSGDVLTLPSGYLEGFTAESDVVVLFVETDDDIRRRFPPAHRPA